MHECIHGLADEAAGAGQDVDGRRVAHPDGEVSLVVAAQLVRREVDGARDPPPLGRLETDHLLVAAAQQTAGRRPAA